MDPSITIIATGAALAIIVVALIVGLGLAFNRGRALGEAQAKLEATEREVKRGHEVINAERENFAAGEKVREEGRRAMADVARLPDDDAVGVLFGAGGQADHPAAPTGPGDHAAGRSA